MNDQSFGLGHFASLLVLAIAGFISVRMQRRRRVESNDSLVQLLHVASILLLFLGLAGLLWLMMGPMMLLAWGAIVVVTGLCVARLRRSEERRLLWLLAIAAEKGVPIAPLARSYASDRADEMSMRARQLADILENGTPLLPALAKVRNYPTASMHMLMTTNDSARWGKDVRAEVEYDDYNLRNESDRTVYLALLLVVVAAVISYMSQNVLPKVQTVIGALNVPIPPMAEPFYAMIVLSTRYSALTMLLGAALGIVAFVIVFAHLNLLPRRFPGVGRLMGPRDSVAVLRVIAAAIVQDRPILGDLRKVADSSPNRWLRRRVRLVVKAIERGDHWYDGLLAARIIQANDRAVIESAERVGNLEWVLNNLCRRKLRGLAARLRIWFNVLFPLTIVVLGCAVLMLLIGFYLPLMNYVFTVM